MTRLDIQFTMFSAFYSPLIATMAGGFLAEEGLEADWSVALPGVSAIAALKDDTAHVVQSALSQSFGPLSRGEVPGVVHFAQINETDGFFLTGRDPDPDFDWRKLEGAEVVLFGGGQPLAMFKYACHKAGIDYERLKPIHPGSAAEIDRTFREGQGAYVQQQGPFPQQLEADGMGHVVAQVGRQVGRCGFSSLCARPDWLETDMALTFTRAYRRARLWLNGSPAAEVALAERPFFPEIDPPALERCIATYQQLGCWAPHIEITREAFDATLDIYSHNGLIDERFTYEQVCASPPDVVKRAKLTPTNRIKTIS